MTEQPHETMERAAARLEKLAADTSPAPWSYEGGAIRRSGAYRDTIAPYAEWEDQTGNAHWICAMSPSVAAPLVAWLRADAERWLVDTAGLSLERALWIQRERYAGALGFARMVLGEAS